MIDADKRKAAFLLHSEGMAEREIEDGRKLSLYEEGTNWLTTYRMIEESKEPDPPLFQERGRAPPPDTD